MERLCFSFKIRPGTLEEYERRHAEIWPELVAELKEAGLSNYSLFALDSENIIGYVECEIDAATSFGMLANADANVRWSQWFEDIIVPSADDQVQTNSFRELWHLA